jgi:hypothetical protein
MSLPGLAAHGFGQVAIAAAAVSPFDILIGTLSANPVFIGLVMLILNLGGRFIVMEVSKEQEQVFQHPWVRRFLIFAVLFVATRNILTALWMTVVVVLVLGYLFNENSSLCLLKGGAAGSSCAAPGAGDDGKPKGGMTRGENSSRSTPPTQSGGMTPEEMDIFRRLNEKYQRNAQADVKAKDASKADVVDPKLIYTANMRLINMSVY